jgi:pimeloyl-ACP methyl ester carboxylesterase
MERFAVDVTEPVLVDLRRRLAATRWPEAFEDPTWSYGVDNHFLRRLCSYWADGYEWRADEARLNAFEQWTTAIRGQTLHFIHRVSVHSEAIPLLILHGWPCSVFEFLGILDQLADPPEGDQAFHVVCPSLPGYGFSTPVVRGTDARKTADLMVELMAQLGYPRFGAHGGDFGAIVLPQMAARHPEALWGMHLTMAMVPAVEDALLTERDRDGLERLAGFQANEWAYSLLQKTTPNTLGYALSDSPVAQAAWIVERFRRWSDGGEYVEAVFSLDELLSNITLYWVTDTGGSSARIYYETNQANSFMAPHSAVPVGYLDLAKDTCRMPRSWLEDRLNIVRWSFSPRGGHFPALEVPGVLVGDIREFFAEIEAHWAYHS